MINGAARWRLSLFSSMIVSCLIYTGYHVPSHGHSSSILRTMVSAKRINGFRFVLISDPAQIQLADENLKGQVDWDVIP